MSMLADRKRKEKWCLNPRGKSWSSDTNKFGQRLLEKMGWSEGQGLGANNQGPTEIVKVRKKDDIKGFGFKENGEEWLKTTSEFNELLDQLGSSQEDNSVDTSGVTSSLEERSKKSKARVHYHKFTRGKDLSRYTEKDLASIIGPEVVKPKSSEEINSIYGSNQVNKGSSEDYFMKKKLAKENTLENTQEGNDDTETNNSFDTSKKKKKKKARHQQDDVTVTESFDSGVGEQESNSECIKNYSNCENSKKKKRKQKLKESELETEAFCDKELRLETLNVQNKKNKKKDFCDGKEEDTDSKQDPSKHMGCEGEENGVGEFIKKEVLSTKEKKHKCRNLNSNDTIFSNEKEKLHDADKAVDSLNTQNEVSGLSTEIVTDNVGSIKKKKKKSKSESNINDDKTSSDPLIDQEHSAGPGSEVCSDNPMLSKKEKKRKGIKGDSYVNCNEIGNETLNNCTESNMEKDEYILEGISSSLNNHGGGNNLSSNTLDNKISKKRKKTTEQETFSISTGSLKSVNESVEITNEEPVKKKKKKHQQENIFVKNESKDESAISLKKNKPNEDEELQTFLAEDKSINSTTRNVLKKEKPKKSDAVEHGSEETNQVNVENIISEDLKIEIKKKNKKKRNKSNQIN